MHDLSYYPNPTTGSIIIDLGMHYEEVSLKILNSVGQEVQGDFYPSCSSIHVELDGPTGLYFVSIRTQNKREALLKVVKK